MTSEGRPTRIIRISLDEHFETLQINCFTITDFIAASACKITALHD